MFCFPQIQQTVLNQDPRVAFGPDLVGQTLNIWIEKVSSCISFNGIFSSSCILKVKVVFRC